MAGNYASSGLSLVWNGEDLSRGLMGATSSPNGDLQEMSFDLKGESTLSQFANQGGVITATYKQTSETLKTIDSFAAGVQLMSEFVETPFQGFLTFKDETGNTGNFVAYKAAIISTGDEAWAEVVGEREITWHCEKLIRTDNVADVMANLAQYLG